MMYSLRFFIFSFLFILLSGDMVAQQSIARKWNETVLELIREDLARPTVHARNLWHSSALMYDVWTFYGGNGSPYFLGNEIEGFTVDIDDFDTSYDTESRMEETMSHALFTLLSSRFLTSEFLTPSYFILRGFMFNNGYDPDYISTDYSSGDAAALGNYIGQQLVEYGFQDGSNEENEYANTYYESVNSPLVMDESGNPDLENLNNWQQLFLVLFIDQSGNQISQVPDFLSPEWGNVTSFALTDEDKTVYTKGDETYNVFLDPGPPPYIDLDDPEGSLEYLKGFELVLKWSGHLDPTENGMIDISPASNGNNPPLPEGEYDLLSYYDFEEGGDFSEGHELNPFTGQPYEPQLVPKGDYTRVLAEFWADGPDSETPPGHWFGILNYVSDHPETTKKYQGEGEAYSDLEWDLKAYFMLGAAMHDAAISAWSVKGYYDYIRPVSVIRKMAEFGQRSDPALPHYSPFGFELEEGFLELVEEDDPLVGNQMQHLHKIKAKVWRGPDYISSPQNDEAGVGWILAENWWPYQRPTFVTPPFAGYVSGHSTFSRAAAEILTKLTGDEFFPGGMGEFAVNKNTFLVFEDGPSESFTLQWATYRDASDETSLSRIWGGIHPPADDIPGRIMGEKVAENVFERAEFYFFRDEDEDGYYSFEDCDDMNAMVNPGTDEICDNLDNDCDTEIDEELTLITYYVDSDGDGYGVESSPIETCAISAPTGYSSLIGDCDDEDATVYPDAPELCDDIDNDCDGDIDEELTISTYYVDTDADGFGNEDNFIESCASLAPAGYSSLAGDCNDEDANINPDAEEICDDIDNNCNGEIDDGLPTFSYYLDNDNDGYGDDAVELILCTTITPVGYVTNNADCDDLNSDINPLIAELCDNIDNDCNGEVDDGLPTFSYYLDSDNDGFGDETEVLSLCSEDIPAGYVTNSEDCDDSQNSIFPGANELSDNGIDEDCNGVDLFKITKVFPNPFTDDLTIHIDQSDPLRVMLLNSVGQVIYSRIVDGENNKYIVTGLSYESSGLYYIYIENQAGEKLHVKKLVKI